jgi:predicted nucleotidyltransferase
MPTIRQARQYASILRRKAKASTIERIILFGSVARDGIGADIDLIVEVPKHVFLEFAAKYSSECRNDLWMFAYNSPRRNRRYYILKTLGIEEGVFRKLEKLMPFNRADLLCLPSGWEQPGYVAGLMETNFNLGRDPHMLTKVLNDAMVLEPSTWEKMLSKFLR